MGSPEPGDRAGAADGQVAEDQMGRDEDLDKELRFHIEERVAELVAAGVTPDEARRRARLEFGGVIQVKEAVRDQHVWSLVNGLLQDVRLAIRSLRATPVVTIVAVLSLALGIGANTAMFSLVNSLLLRTLPVREPGRLVTVRSHEPEGFPEWSYPVWDEVRQRPQLFDGVAAWSPTVPANVTTNGDTQKADGLFASSSFFETLGVPAFIGRTFSGADDRRGGGPDGPVAVISYGFWQRRFSGSASAIGSTVTLENVPFTVVGITPPDFFGADVGRTFDVIVPLGTEPLVSRSESRIASSSVSWLNIVARLKSQETIDTATAALRGIGPQILDATLPEDWPKAALDDYRARVFSLAPAATGDSSLRGTYQRPLLTIM